MVRCGKRQDAEGGSLKQGLELRGNSYPGFDK